MSLFCDVIVQATAQLALILSGTYLTFSHTICVGVICLNDCLTRLGVRSTLENASEVKAAITKALVID